MRGDGKGDLPFKTNPHPMPCIPPSLPKFEERNSQGWRERGAGDSGVQQVVLCRKRAKIRRIRVGEGACFSV